MEIGERLSNFDQNKKKAVGTFIYMSPEMMLNQDYDEKADIWSLGVIFYLLLTKTHPLQYLSERVVKEDLKDYVRKTLQSSHPEDLIDFESKDLEDLPADAEYLLKKMLTIDPNGRISAYQILELQDLLTTQYNEYVAKLKEDNGKDQKDNQANGQYTIDNVAFENILTSAGTPQLRLLKKRILEVFSTKIITPEESDELSTLFNSMEISANASVDHDKVDLIYSVYSEGHFLEEDMAEEDINAYKELMGTQAEYSEKDFIKSVVVFKNLMNPSKATCSKIFEILDSKDKGYITLDDIKVYLTNNGSD